MARRSWFKRLVWTFVILLVLGGVGAGFAVHMLRGTPDWYAPSHLSEADKLSAAGKVEDLLKRLQAHVVRPSGATDLEQRFEAVKRTAEQSRLVTSERPSEPFQLEFTETQLNAFYDKWADYKDRRALIERYVDGPQLAIRDGQLILAGQVKSMGVVVSMIFEPKVVGDGTVSLKLARVQGGMLPIPDAFWADKRASIQNMLREKLPGYQQGAALSVDGYANGDLASAALNEMLLAMLRNTSSPAVVFVPVDPLTGKLAPSMPVKITALSMKDRTLMMTAERMTEIEKQQLIDTVKKPVAP